jgi:hypothetical protein
MGTKIAFALISGIFNWTIIGWLLAMSVSLDNEG